jgi:hypothetical protein
MDRIANLTPEQAQHALLNLFDLLPEGWWQDGKPTPYDVKELAGQVPEFTAALESRDDAARGEVARELLRRFAGFDAARPLVDEAIEKSLAPHLVPLPLLILPLLIVLSGVEIKTPSGATLLRIGVPGSGAELVKAFGELASKLPSGAWSWLAHLGGGKA